MATARPWQAVGNGVRLWVRLTPRGGRDAIDGVETLADGRVVLKARVRSAPADNEANAALVALIAATVGVRPSAVDLIAGRTARIKQVAISGDPATLIAALDNIL